MNVKNISIKNDDLVSVILPIYNAEKYLEDAISSIVNQTYKNIELICIDDGSTDSSLDIIKAFSNMDKRIKIITRENKGLIYSLNEGIRVSLGKFIARMDADDISDVSRIEKQVLFLNDNPSVNILGTFCYRVDECNAVIGKNKKPVTDCEIKAGLLFHNQIIHPSVMINGVDKKDLYFDDKFKSAEDYELWLRLSKRYIFANIPEYLLRYRVLSTSITRSRNVEQQKSTHDALELHFLPNRFFSKKRNKVVSYIDRVLCYKHKSLNNTLHQIMYCLKKSLKVY